MRAYLDDDVREAVRAPVEPARGPPPGALAEEIQLLLRQAAQTRLRVHDAIEEADLPYTEVAAEVDRLVATMQEAAARAQRLHEGLRDAPPDEVAARLERVEGRERPGQGGARPALGDQLAVQRRMEAQLGPLLRRDGPDADRARHRARQPHLRLGVERPDNQAAGGRRGARAARRHGRGAAGIDQGSVTVAKVPR